MADAAPTTRRRKAPPKATPKTEISAAATEASEKVVQLRQAVQDRADALNDWAHDQARAIATTARERPLAAAGISAGAAFAAGLVFGLLLARAADPQPRIATWKDRVLDLSPW